MNKKQKTNIINALLALPKGFKLCILDKGVRKYVFKPWGFGLLSYLVTLSIAYYLHPLLLNRISENSGSFLSTVAYYFSWTAISALLIVASSVISFIFVLITTAFFQTEIAIEVIKDKYSYLETESIISETTRTILTEAAKIVWILPIFIIVFILGLIPFLTPFAILFNSWLIAYQFCDVTLDLFKTKSKQRFKFARQNFIFLAIIGGSYLALWAIPFLGIFLTPIAIAGTAWALKESNLLEEFKNC